MSISTHFDALAAYRASAIRIVPVQGEPEDWLGEGSGLESSFDTLGQGALLAVLRDPRIASVTLADADLEICALREGGGGRLRVIWRTETIIDEYVEIPPMLPRRAGPLFRPDPASAVSAEGLTAALHDPEVTLYAIEDLGGAISVYSRGQHGPGVGALPLCGTVMPCAPADLGAPSFLATHGVRMAYVIGAMAGGIASVEVVLAAARAGLLSFFGSGGLPLEAVESALQRVTSEVGDGPFGFNLLHNPVEPDVEDKTVDLYLKYGVRTVEASAFMGLTPAVVRYRFHGIALGPDGNPVCKNRVFAKISRPEVAEKFLRPPPKDILDALVARGAMSSGQAELAALLPVAEDITAEADSGGHTDHRPLVVLVPSIRALRDKIAEECGYAARKIAPRIGAAGGLGTPSAIWAALSLGADYVMTGSVNQAAVEAGTSVLAKEMLSAASWWEMASGPAPDMFEIGAKVQVLARGSMYAQRAQRLYDIYKGYPSIDAIPQDERERIEKQIFRRPLAEVWEETRSYWQARDSRQLDKAAREPRHQMALIFRWYLGMTSRWARMGDEDRKRDFQMWCGPAMGAFNEWARGTPLEPLSGRTIASIADALMRGTAVIARIRDAERLGLPLRAGVERIPT